MWLFATAVLVIVALLLLKFPRQTLIVLGALLGVVALGGAYWWWEEMGRQRYVDISVSYTPTVAPCSSEFPLRLEVFNRSGSVVSYSSVYLAAYPPGRSTNIAPYQSYTSDQIIAPGTGMTYCYSAPKLGEQVDPASAVWSVESRSVSFRD